LLLTEIEFSEKVAKARRRKVARAFLFLETAKHPIAKGKKHPFQPGNQYFESLLLLTEIEFSEKVTIARRRKVARAFFI
jgi:hypothetical protein